MIKNLLVAISLTALAQTTVTSIVDSLPSAFLGEWMIVYDDAAWARTCSNTEGGGFELLNVTPKRFYINEWGCSFRTITIGKRPHGGNAQTDITAHLICSGESERSSQHLQVWSLFRMGKDIYLTIADINDVSTSLYKKCK
jgi:hypothetical protein